MAIEGSTGGKLGRRLRLGMVGGGQGAFIGGVHRIAARLDDRYELVAGALSSDPQRAADSARELGLAEDRSYASYAEMAQREAEREDGIDVVSLSPRRRCPRPTPERVLAAARRSDAGFS